MQFRSETVTLAGRALAVQTEHHPAGRRFVGLIDGQACVSGSSYERTVHKLLRRALYHVPRL